MTNSFYEEMKRDFEFEEARGARAGCIVVVAAIFILFVLAVVVGVSIVKVLF